LPTVVITVKGVPVYCWKDDRFHPARDVLRLIGADAGAGDVGEPVAEEVFGVVELEEALLDKRQRRLDVRPGDRHARADKRGGRVELKARAGFAQLGLKIAGVAVVKDCRGPVQVFVFVGSVADRDKPVCAARGGVYRPQEHRVAEIARRVGGAKRRRARSSSC